MYVSCLRFDLSGIESTRARVIVLLIGRAFMCLIGGRFRIYLRERLRGQVQGTRAKVAYICKCVQVEWIVIDLVVRGEGV